MPQADDRGIVFTSTTDLEETSENETDETNNNNEPVVKIDSDYDGLDDDDELIAGTDPNNPDTDADKLLDGQEVHLYATDPLVVDTDGDTYSDFEEVMVLPSQYPNITIKPNDPDDDGDGFHPLASMPGYPVQPDCNNFDSDTYPGAPDQFGDGENSDCKIDKPTATHTFGKGYTVTATITELSVTEYAVIIEADGGEYHGETRVDPYAANATAGCLYFCAADDYDLQYEMGALTGYQDSHGCYSFVNLNGVGYDVVKVNPLQYQITATGKQNNHNGPTHATVVLNVGD
jgi:hypothetical protein